MAPGSRHCGRIPSRRDRGFHRRQGGRSPASGRSQPRRRWSPGVAPLPRGRADGRVRAVVRPAIGCRARRLWHARIRHGDLRPGRVAAQPLPCPLRDGDGAQPVRGSHVVHPVACRSALLGLAARPDPARPADLPAGRRRCARSTSWPSAAPPPSSSPPGWPPPTCSTRPCKTATSSSSTRRHSWSCPWRWRSTRPWSPGRSCWPWPWSRRCWSRRIPPC